LLDHLAKSSGERRAYAIAGLGGIHKNVNKDAKDEIIVKLLVLWYGEEPLLCWLCFDTLKALLSKDELDNIINEAFESKSYLLRLQAIELKQLVNDLHLSTYFVFGNFKVYQKGGGKKIAADVFMSSWLHPTWRFKIHSTLDWSRDKEAIPAMIAVLQSENKWIRVYSALALGHLLEDKIAVQALIALLERETESVVIETILSSLENLATDEVLKTVRNYSSR
jgi:HEAT repeat protein